MSVIFADAHMWEDAEELYNARTGAGMMKMAVKARIEVNNNVCEFIQRDKSHPQSDELCNKSRS